MFSTILRFSFALAYMMLYLMFSVGNAQNSEKPNIIYINADDLGYGDTGAYGATKVRTPNIDKLAKQGIRFTDAHTVSAVCTPSRYALMTGEYPLRNNNLSSAVFSRDSLVVDTHKLTIAKVMQNQGYATAAIGKWHLGFGNKKPVDWNTELKPGPLELGFDYYYGVPVVNSHPPFVYVENHKVVGCVADDPLVYGKEAATQPYPEKWNRGNQKLGGAKKAHGLYIDHQVGTTLKEKAVDYIKKHKATPFFLYFATTNIHHPFTPEERFLGTSDAGRYGDFIHELDWIVGEIMSTLESEGIAKNTLLILTSDNGGMLNQGGQDAYAMAHKINGDLLGFKFDVWEGGHRIPFIARWPKRIKQGTVSDKLISNVDMLATFAGVFEAEIPKNQAVDSYNLLPVLLNTTDSNLRTELLIASNNLKNLGLRQGKWMYINAQGGGGFEAKHQGMHAFGGPSVFPFTNQKNSDIENGKLKADAPKAQLYNLETDPYQTTNVYRDYPEIAKAMQLRMEEIRRGAEK